MFPHHSTKLIKKIFAENDKNAKRCIDILLKEKENTDLNDKSLDIEEWSDGDEAIRAKNQQKQLNKQLIQNGENSNDSSDLNENNTKKRKSTNG
jgi:hypothetical protein